MNDKLVDRPEMILEADSRLRKISWFQYKWLSFDRKDRHFVINQILALIPDERKKIAEEIKKNRPTIVCLCGSTKFKDAFTKAQLEETLAGKIVLTIGCNMKSDTEIFGHLSKQDFDSTKLKLDELHKRKIDLADEVMILNVGGYIGESTQSELSYAINENKQITYLEPLGTNSGKAILDKLKGEKDG